VVIDYDLLFKTDNEQLPQLALAIKRAEDLFKLRYWNPAITKKESLKQNKKLTNSVLFLLLITAYNYRYFSFSYN
jgi:hypothetical protein